MKLIYSLASSLILLSLLMHGCVNYSVPHRLGEATIETLNQNEHSSKQVSLCHVEIDDQGELQSYTQLEKVVEKIKSESKNKNLLVVVFIHGWNNNSRENPKHGGHNLHSFRESLEKLTAAQAEIGGRKPLGIMVSWRGRTLKPLPIFFDYFHRYSAAQRVGGIAGAEVIHQIGYTARNARSGNRIIMVGHSFGGLVLESSISEVLAAQIAKAHAKDKTIQADNFPADLVVMINPAESGLVSRRLIATMRNRNLTGAGNSKDAPLIVSMTSDKDNATKALYPITNLLGRYIPPFNFFNTSTSGYYRRGSRSHVTGNGHSYEWGTQKKAHKTTVGHFSEIHSHKLKKMYKSEKLPKLSQIIQANVSPWNHDPSQDYLFKIVGTNQTYQFKEISTKQYNQTPFWIMKIPKEIVGNHNDIWNSNFVGTLTALMKLRQPAPSAAAPTPLKPKEGLRIQLKQL